MGSPFFIPADCFFGVLICNPEQNLLPTGLTRGAFHKLNQDQSVSQSWSEANVSSPSPLIYFMTLKHRPEAPSTDHINSEKKIDTLRRSCNVEQPQSNTY